MYEKQYPHEGMIVFVKKEEPNGYEHVAQLIIEQSIFQYQKNKLMEQIDESLIAGNKSLFFELSSQYNKLLEKYGYLQTKPTGESA
ncbi:uncharacterized protein YpiB (UPF0302 family) [Anoxybacillus calidus]|jgi:uncharacterized protein YpiB (UPF0302 family)|uniref:Uncharacterized protein YpiB (UPF0302 family) n=1 Tax=[Anoxybacillus] calidus TaxID=575178 RepID=A0A7V9Z2M6_9BACL|nr:IDEAL domain-containing protein [Anoxybacillus calidus]MBA2872788.1 uncharacterized protein YpiB (UPF0302 family) [Anoxybacillus calidus]